MRVVNHADPAPRESSNVGRTDVHAMSRQALLVQNAKVAQTLHRPGVAAVLRDVDVEARAQRLVHFHRAAKRRVREREGSVQAEGGGHQTVATGAIDETDVFSNALQGLYRPFAVGSLVAQHAAQADVSKRLVDAVQASRAGVRTGMVV